ncbi:MAG: protease pro-enzyme activation domain-containing protein [Terracidiphilus sp.]
MLRILGKNGLAIAAVLSIAVSVCQGQSFLTHHVRQATQDGTARLLGPLSATQNLRLVITLPLRNQDQLDQLLKDLYDPGSPSYRQFLTVEQFTAQFGPTQQDYDALINFAKENGLTVVGDSPNRLNVQVAGSVANIDRAFHVNMGVYQHPTENRTFYAPDREPTTNLTFALWHVSGLDNFSIPHPAGLDKNPASSGSRSGATTGSGPSASFLGSDMRAAYYGGTALTGAGQSLGLLEYYGTDLADLTTYFTNAKQTNNVPISLVSTDGTSTSCIYTRAGGDCDDTEQTLDMTQALGMAPGLSSLVMYVGSTDAAIFNAMATASPLNAQLSSSWTWYPADPSTDDPYFEEFAAQGQNLFQAAGDDKKWTTSGTASEIYPADDVYVTSVGGTDLTTSAAGGPWASETAWSDSGGGISPHKYAIPSWQTAAAAGCASCSQTYRNGPDVSANANFTFYVCADQTTCTANEYGGTSFATPMWAGYLALINQQSVANGNKTLGFINPSLYSIGAGSSYDADFHDITSGSNGYSATTGYDLATGWGSPNGSGLINALAGTSSTPGFSLSASPASVSVVQGNAGTSTVTSTVFGGFNSSVSLSASGNPSGVTIGFNPTSFAAGAGSSTVTFTVASTVTPAKYPITISGLSGNTTENTTVSLTVTAPVTANFAISVSPTSGSLRRGRSGYVTVSTAVSGGFNSAVSLSATGMPTGVTASFSPNPIAAPGSGSSRLTFTVARTATTGTYPITITGTGGGATHTTTFSLQVQ